MKILILILLIFLPIQTISAENYMDLIKELAGEHEDSEYGHDIAALDFNGDGIDDLVVGSWKWDPDYPAQPPIAIGKLYFYIGKEQNFADTVDFTMSGSKDSLSWQQSVGMFIVNLGDMNNDGFEDLGFADGTKDDTGNYLMNANILFGGNPCDTIPDHIFSFIYPDYNGSVSTYIHPLGDINNDGYDDAGIFVGPYINGIYSDVLQEAYLIYGNEYELIYLGTYGYYGGSYGWANFRGIGDVNVDGYYDFIIGYGVNEDATFYNLLFYGGTEIDSIPDIIINDHIAIPYLNTAGGIACGDWNGDGKDDFIGSCCSDASQGLGVWYGSDPLVLSPQMFVEYYSSIGKFRLYDFGDLNNDGCDDIAAGLHWYGGGHGRAYIYLGGQNGTCDLQIEAPYGFGGMGWATAIGDFNNDGCDDIALGSPWENWSVSHLYDDKGMVFVFAGNEDLEEANPPAIDEIPHQYETHYMDAYPNPTTKEIFFSIKNNLIHNLEIYIYNSKGQKVDCVTVKEREFAWKAENITSGVYFCSLVKDKKILEVKKVVIINK